MNEKTISSQTIYEGKVITLKVDQVELPNGKTASREIVTHPGAVAVMAITDDNRLVVVRQFRKPLGRTIVEIPAGKLEPGEEPVVCAHRELEEETGYTTRTMQHVASCYTSPGFADEIIHLYRTDGLIAGEAKPDEDEFVELMHITVEEAQQLIESGEICDAKTIMAVYAWKLESRT
ncbi:ADP-ribose pyrophosphatase [Aneurinibacillus soli]|uniref:ADP-ribose pyrophosphatase n=1 Tax=Aneurinibacillus soli TaxID=1500254 RepID=A0A0U4WL28_9BACL|nr:NUDIX hydrolase [Aneurinibacillus soli]PYE62813.1 ADP-ribose pyrophosphatase [Aneurinibacillus soli]BAU29129.1 ADP-ribose pyrophosphatase [Aneurinibacillus soli]